MLAVEDVHKLVEHALQLHRSQVVNCLHREVAEEEDGEEGGGDVKWRGLWGYGWFTAPHSHHLPYLAL